MNDPHVESLAYRISSGEHADFSRAAPMEYETDEFKIAIADGLLTATMKAHYPEVAQAQTAVEAFLRSWELDLALRHGPGTIKFTFDRPVVIDRQPTPGSIVIYATGSAIALSGGNAIAVTGFSRYPEPPTGIVRDDAVDAMFARYTLYREGRTLLGEAANYCLTELERKAGGRAPASQRYCISGKVISKLASLSASKGGALLARPQDVRRNSHQQKNNGSPM